MAEITPNVTPIPAARGTVFRATWPHMKAGDTGAPIPTVTADAASVQCLGDWGQVGCLVVVEGSNQDMAETGGFSVLSDLRGNDLSLRGEGVERIELPIGVIRPRVTGGDETTDITVIALVRSQL